LCLITNVIEILGTLSVKSSNRLVLLLWRNWSCLFEIIIPLSFTLNIKRSVSAVSHSSLLISICLSLLSYLPFWGAFVPYLIYAFSFFSKVINFSFVSLIGLLEASISLNLVLIKHWFSNIVLNCLIELHFIAGFHFLVEVVHQICISSSTVFLG
jgi:hypothetical protein